MSPSSTSPSAGAGSAAGGGTIGRGGRAESAGTLGGLGRADAGALGGSSASPGISSSSISTSSSSSPSDPSAMPCGHAHYRYPWIIVSMDTGPPAQACFRSARRSLPNLLVPIDLHDGVPTAPSLFALSEGRRVARAAGVTVFAVVMTERRVDDQVASRLGRAGADKVLACEGPGLGAPPLDATHGPALYAAVERVPPLLVLFPAGGAGAQLGPGLASRLGGAFAAAADLEVGAAATPPAAGVGRLRV